MRLRMMVVGLLFGCASVALAGTPAALATAPPAHSTFAVSLRVLGAHGVTYPAGTVDFHRLGLDDNVPLAPRQRVDEALQPGSYTVTVSTPHAVCATAPLLVRLSSTVAGYPVTCHPIPTCTAGDPTDRCTPLGLLGPWTSARVLDSGRTLVVSFPGFCGDNPLDPYRAHVTVASGRVTVGIYGARPFSNLCATTRTLDVYLAQPLGSRTVYDAFDDSVRIA